MIVLTSMGIDPFRALFATDASQRKLNQIKMAINQAFADSVPRGEHRVLEDAAHATFHVDRPDAVVQAIRDLLDRAHKCRPYKLARVGGLRHLPQKMHRLDTPTHR
jgi:hypothetical protein